MTEPAPTEGTATKVFIVVTVVSILALWREAGVLVAIAWLIVLGLLGRAVRAWQERRSAKRDAP